VLENITIAAEASYCADGQRLTDLRKVNFIYGANGSGKTTISRVVAAPHEYPSCSVSWSGGLPQECLVYNLDFIERNFKATLQGIFTLGEEDKATLEKIDQTVEKINALNSSISGIEENLDGAESSTGKRGELKSLRTEFEGQCWNLMKRHEKHFQDAIKGYRGKKSNFCDKLLAEFEANEAELHTLENLQQRTKIVFDDTVSRVSSISVPDSTDLIRLEDSTILTKKIIGQGDIDITAIIDRLNNSDWVKEGLDYFDRSEPTCPFCQQEVDAARAKKIADYFDETYEKDIADITRAIDGYDVAATRYIKSLEEIANTDSPYIDTERLQAMVGRINSLLGLNAQHLARKKKEPSAVVTLEKNKVIYDEIADFIKKVNESIKDHNATVDDITNQKKVLTADVWKYILEEARGTIEAFNNNKSSLEKAIEGMNSSLQRKQSERSEARRALRTLEQGITSVKPTVDEINALLEQFGFRGFRLTTSEKQKNLYEIVRLDGSNAASTLSEGEKTFITFLYFYHLIRGSVSESGMTTNRIVVFDDPVSSLDSDVLFIVSSLIKRIIAMSLEPNGLVRQVFVLTHNIYFHKEVSFDPNRGKRCRAHETFWIVKKIDDVSVVERFDHNPIKTSYELLWSEVRSESRSNMTIQNTLRRILENYFKILGNMDKDKIIDQFDGRDKIICGSMFSWVNDGSHSAYDDLYISSDDTVIESYLRVFREIFEVTEHTAHYNMMIGSEQTAAISI